MPDATVCAVIALALLLVGCGHKHESGQAHAEGAPENGHGHEHEPGVVFSPKSGLFVPPETAKFIGLEVVDVEERKVASTLRFTALVFREANESQPVPGKSGTASSAEASAMVSPADAARLQEGQPITLEANGTMLPGRVTGVKQQLAMASGQVEVLLAIPAIAGEPPLRHGAFVTVNAPLGGQKAVTSVPRPALLRTAEGDFVYTVSGDHFVRAPVKAGVMNSEFVEVTDGLYPGDRVVVRPVMTLWLAELQSIRGGKACADGH